MKPFVFLSIFSALLASCGTSSVISEDSVPVSVSIKWVNDDGTILQTERCNKNNINSAKYLGSTPKKARTEQFTFYFDKWSEPVEQANGDIVYTATYREVINKYTITWKNSNGVVLEIDNDVPYGTTPTYDAVTPTREKDAQYTYSFNDWNPSIHSVTGDETYIASYNTALNYYYCYLDANTGDCEIDSLYIGYGQNYSLPTPTKLGYTFLGWYDGSTKVLQESKWNYSSDKHLIAKWEVIKFTIYYALNGGTNNSNNPSSYTVDDTVTFSAPSKTGYTFLGWYVDENVTTGIPEGSTGTVNVEARWSADLHSLSITSEDTSKGTVAITSGSGYSNESITVVATPVGDCVFKGWYHEPIKVSDDATYTFTMPIYDYSLVAHFFTKAEEEEEKHAIKYATRPILSSDGKTITYGLYPQTNVNDSSLISSLNALTTPESNGWFLYNDEYYAKVSATPEGSSYKFDNGTKIVSGTTYWFKCEPITWNVLSKKNGEYYILSSVLLDAHYYYNILLNRTIDGKTIYPNNYEYSDIRAWLNNDFYNSAFALGNSHIQTTTVDNSASTTNLTSNTYACNNTQDKVFLPSYKDYINSSYGFTASTGWPNNRYCKTTDWARARGACCSTNSAYLYNGYYWTRSPSSDFDVYAWYVNYAGRFDGLYVTNTNRSVRPGLTIKIE